MTQPISIEALEGVVALLPTPSTDAAGRPDAPFAVDLDESERATRLLIEAGVAAIMTNGTLGEMATLSHEEWSRFNDVVLSTARAHAPNLPVFAGVTSLSTRATIGLAREVQQMGGRGIFIGRPFWCPLDVASIVSFYAAVADAVPELRMVIYDNPEAFKGPIPTPAYEQLAQIPEILAAKYTAMTPKFQQDMAAVDGRMRLLPLEVDWFAAYAMWAEATPACWSSSVTCGPAPAMALADALVANDLIRAREITRRIAYTYETFLAVQNFAEFSKYNIPLEKVRTDAAGFMKAGPGRHPYDSAPKPYVEGAVESGRRWARLAEELASERQQAQTA